MEIQSASDIQMSFMKLLVAQLKNQNPLEPLDNSEMTSQLAQLSQLSQLENLNSRFDQALNQVQTGYASSLVGKQVSFREPATEQVVSGTVEQVQMEGEQIWLIVGDYAVPLEEIQAVGT